MPSLSVVDFLRRMLLASCVLLGGARTAQGQDLTLVGATVYPSPAASPLKNATLVIVGGKIQSVSPASTASVPKSTVTLDCRGKVIVAGFWNSHVHFTDPSWDAADKLPTAQVNAQLRGMLTRWGFTTVWDLGSMPSNTLALRRRIEAGEIAGPALLLAGDIFPKDGHPIYIPKEIDVPEADSPAQARTMAESYMVLGLDGIKLFTGAFMGPDKPVINMPAEIARSAVDVAHAKGKKVFTHPQNYAGVDNALTAGVDVLAHTIPGEGAFTPSELSRMKAQHVALIPTLALWPIVTEGAAQDVRDRFLQSGINELKAYASQGGVILFGTDVGFQKEFDTTHELEYMGRALSWSHVLASLTTNPSDFFQMSGKGRVEAGKDADLVILDADPASDVRNLTKVWATIRAGKIIYQRPN